MPRYFCFAFVAGLLAVELVSSGAFAVEKMSTPPTPLTSLGPTASADDTARIMAGLTPSSGSPLASVAADPLWKQYAMSFDENWSQLDARQMLKVRAWTAKNIKDQSSVLFYMFSGPDYLYADALMPAANTYVMSGLEPVGKVPDLRKLNSRELNSALNELRHSMASLLNLSFFQTKLMSGELKLDRIVGTTPVLMVFLSRVGKTIYDVNFYDLASDGSLHPPEDKIKTTSHAVKITFSDNVGPKKTLYYFSTNVANKGVRSNGFLTFCDRLGVGDSLVKGASYLMHLDDFSDVRNFLLAHSNMILQDDTGVPIRFLDTSWKLHPFGSYVGPIRMFGRESQPDMFKLFREQKPGELNFGIGYRYSLGGSNLVLAVKDRSAAAAELTSTSPPATKAAPASTSAKPQVAPTKSSKVVYRRRSESKTAANWFPQMFGYSP
jgi:hypothetical protein